MDLVPLESSVEEVVSEERCELLEERFFLKGLKHKINDS